MLTGFTNETAPLTDWEYELVPSVVAYLKTAYGKDNAVFNQQIIRAVPEIKSEARVRKIINHIRQNNLVPCLLASSKGYFIAQTEQEMKDYEDSLRGRELAIRNVRESIEAQRKARFGGVWDGRLF